MSYIRPLSNPEGLYIWSDDKRITITHTVKRPLASHADDEFTIPRHVLHGLARKWLTTMGDNAVYRGADIVERHIYTKTGRRTPAGWNPIRDSKPAAWLYRFSYNRHWFFMWRVTWAYICQGIGERR